MNFTPAGASPLTEKAVENTPKKVFVVSGSQVGTLPVLVKVDGVVVVVHEDDGHSWYQTLTPDEYYTDRREALAVALKKAQLQVTQANTDVNRILAELQSL